MLGRGFYGCFTVGCVRVLVRVLFLRRVWSRMGVELGGLGVGWGGLLGCRLF